MHNYKLHHNSGFSLIELLVAIAIMTVIAAVALPNFISARERARDARKKSEMKQLKNALQMYSNDIQAYPLTSSSCTGGGFQIAGCKAGGTSCCPCSTTYDFAVSGSSDASCTTPTNIYMKKYIVALSGLAYFSNGTVYCARIALENQSDPDILASQSLCKDACSTSTHASASCTGSNYCICSD